jgi:hypothetical protein
LGHIRLFQIGGKARRDSGFALKSFYRVLQKSDQLSGIHVERFHLLHQLPELQHLFAQQSLNAGQGVISCIDYNTGEMQVGGTPVDPGTVFSCPNPPRPGTTRVRLNDTIGRFGKSHAAIGGCAGKTNCIEEAGFDPLQVTEPTAELRPLT